MRPRSPNSYFPNINTWLALTHREHVHQAAAWRWLDGVAPEATLYFCRFTQMGFLRLLTSEAVMGRKNVMNQRQAWGAYDRWILSGGAELLEEPEGLDAGFRFLTQHGQASPKIWMDGYLAAFAELANLPLVTFDRAFRGKLKHLLILET